MYVYNKKIDVKGLEAEIKSSPISDHYDYLDYDAYNEIVTVHTTIELSSEEQDVLQGLITDHSNTFFTSFDYIFESTKTTQQQNIQFGQSLLHDWMRKNTLDGMTVKQSLWVFSRFEEFEIQCDFGNKRVDLFKMFYSGALPTVYFALLQVTPDSMTEDHHWLTQERLDWVKDRVRNHIGEGMANYIEQLGS